MLILYFFIIIINKLGEVVCIDYLNFNLIMCTMREGYEGFIIYLSVIILNLFVSEFNYIFLRSWYILNIFYIIKNF